MKPLISVLVPTRKRTVLLQKMLRSLMTTCENQENIEIVLRIDIDDDETMRYLSSMPLQCLTVVGPRYDGYATLAKYINEAARLSRADLMIVINDDVEFKTKDWDRKLVEAAELHPDGIFNIGVDTVMNNDNFVFPCQSRRQVDVLGCFFDDRLVYPDIWLRDVLMAFGRAVHVLDVVVDHQWIGLTPDQQRAIPLTQKAGYSELYDRCVREAIVKIHKALAMDEERKAVFEAQLEEYLD